MLSAREIQVAEMISRGMIEKEIADKIFVSPATVHTHARNIRIKLNLHNNADIAREYIVNYDTTVRNRITRSYSAGRRIGVIAGWAGHAANFAKCSLQKIRAKKNRTAPANRQAESGQAERTHLLQLVRIANNNLNQHNDMKDDDVLQKIDRLGKLMDFTVPELDELIKIGVELKKLKNECNS